MSEQADDAPINEIRERHVATGNPSDPHCEWCSSPDYPIWPCDTADLLEVIDAQRAIMDAQSRVSEQHRKRVQELIFERDALRARAERAESERDALQAAMQAAWDSSRAALAAASEGE